MSTLLSAYPIQSKTPIETVEALRAHLIQAAGIELSTVPLYLYAAYSIKTSGYSQWSTGKSAFDTIRSVVIEEMLHLCLARNLLLAVGGGDFKFYNKDFIFKYPADMPHRIPRLEFRLSPCNVEVVKDIFMQLELPMEPEPPEAFADDGHIDEYRSLGDFYRAIKDGFKTLAGDPLQNIWDETSFDKQYSRAYWGGGRPIVVKDLETAFQAIDTIVEQGEGAAPGSSTVPIDPTKGVDPWHPDKVETELSHYAKFVQIWEGIDEIGEVWPVPDNPKPEDFDFKNADPWGPPVGDLAKFFDAAYCYVLCMLDKLYDTEMKFQTVKEGTSAVSERYGLERTFLAAMGGLLYPIAQLLVRTPVTTEMNAAPGFRFYKFPEQKNKKAHLATLCDDLLGAFPSLGGDDSVRQLIDRLPDV
jgi:hypothetical protein